jgi:hypothetical protein
MAGEPAAILSSLTGFFSIQARNMSCTKPMGASVLIDPAEAWDRET